MIIRKTKGALPFINTRKVENPMILFSGNLNVWTKEVCCNREILAYNYQLSTW